MLVGTVWFSYRTWRYLLRMLKGSSFLTSARRIAPSRYSRRSWFGGMRYLATRHWLWRSRLRHLESPWFTMN